MIDQSNGTVACVVSVFAQSIQVRNSIPNCQCSQAQQADHFFFRVMPNSSSCQCCLHYRLTPADEGVCLLLLVSKFGTVNCSGILLFVLA